MEYNLIMAVKFVLSAENNPDTFTRVPKKLLSPEREHLVCGATDTVSPEEITTIHETSRSPDIRRTLHFRMKLSPLFQRQQVHDVVQGCRQSSILIQHQKKNSKEGNLAFLEIGVSMDIFQVNYIHYLTLIDCGPTRYTI